MVNYQGSVSINTSICEHEARVHGSQSEGRNAGKHELHFDVGVRLSGPVSHGVIYESSKENPFLAYLSLPLILLISRILFDGGKTLHRVDGVALQEIGKVGRNIQEVTQRRSFYCWIRWLSRSYVSIAQLQRYHPKICILN